MAAITFQQQFDPQADPNDPQEDPTAFFLLTIYEGGRVTVTDRNGALLMDQYWFGVRFTAYFFYTVFTNWFLICHSASTNQLFFLRWTGNSFFETVLPRPWEWVPRSVTYEEGAPVLTSVAPSQHFSKDLLLAGGQWLTNITTGFNRPKTIFGSAAKCVDNLGINGLEAPIQAGGTGGNAVPSVTIPANEEFNTVIAHNDGQYLRRVALFTNTGRVFTLHGDTPQLPQLTITFTAQVNVSIVRLDGTVTTDASQWVNLLTNAFAGAFGPGTVVHFNGGRPLRNLRLRTAIYAPFLIPFTVLAPILAEDCIWG